MVTQDVTFSGPSIRDEWTGSEHPVPVRTLPELFADAVAGHADRTAVWSDAGPLSFAELDAAANRLARLLIGRGAGPERVVALVLPRSVQIVVAQLAVAKAGAAFLPVDPAYPARRIEFMLTDACPAVVVTLADLATGLPATVDERSEEQTSELQSPDQLVCRRSL